MQYPTSLPPHGTMSVYTVGNTAHPGRALLLLHGRGATAENIVQVTEHLSLPTDVVVLAPQAANHEWYPERFLVPHAANEPYLTAALDRVDALMTMVATTWQIAPAQVVLVGFSQGACLVAEYLKRHPRRYLAAAIWSGGLIGDVTEVAADVPGSLAGTPVYIGCDILDGHIPADRVSTTAAYLAAHDASVTHEWYEHFGHAVHSRGIAWLAQNLC
jgi:phospholipase/carboxylesterase